MLRIKPGSVDCKASSLPTAFDGNICLHLPISIPVLIYSEVNLALPLRDHDALLSDNSEERYCFRTSFFVCFILSTPAVLRDYSWMYLGVIPSGAQETMWDAGD